LLLKFFSHPIAHGYLRGIAEEFGESTNSIRIELGKLQEAGLIDSKQEGQKIVYRANVKNPFYLELVSVVSKYLGFDQLLEGVLNRIGDLQAAYVVGDYASGIDSGEIEVLLIGDIDRSYALKLAERAESELGRRILLGFIEDMDDWSPEGHYLKLLGE
jgi:DNA-binding transcriptional ArsR family regulator